MMQTKTTTVKLEVGCLHNVILILCQCVIVITLTVTFLSVPAWTIILWHGNHWVSAKCLIFFYCFLLLLLFFNYEIYTVILCRILFSYVIAACL